MPYLAFVTYTEIICIDKRVIVKCFLFQEVIKGGSGEYQMFLELSKHVGLARCNFDLGNIQSLRYLK